MKTIDRIRETFAEVNRRGLAGALASLALAGLALAQTSPRVLPIAQVQGLDRSADGSLWGIASGEVLCLEDGRAWRTVVAAPTGGALLVARDGSRGAFWSREGLRSFALGEGERSSAEVVVPLPEDPSTWGALHGEDAWLAWASCFAYQGMHDCLAREGIVTFVALSRDEGARWSPAARVAGAAVLAGAPFPEGGFALLLGGGGVLRVESADEPGGAPRIEILREADCARSDPSRPDYESWIVFEDGAHGRTGGRAYAGGHAELRTEDGGRTWAHAGSSESVGVGAFHLPSGVLVELRYGRGPEPYRVRTDPDAAWDELVAFGSTFSEARVDATGGLLVRSDGWHRLAADGSRWESLGLSGEERAR